MPRISAVILAGLLALAVQNSASAYDMHGHAPLAPAGFTPVALSIPDTDVVDQNGRMVKFYRDLVKGRAVAINFIFTTCKTTCPMLTAAFAAVQEAVGDRFGRDLFLISISLDPENDTALELAAYAQKFGAKPGWTFVTGQPADMAILLKALNASAPVKEDHTAIALIGNGVPNKWLRAYGLNSAPVLAAALRQAATSEPKAKAEGASYFTDSQLIDQQVRTVHCSDDIVRHRPILIPSLFTSCSGVCPMAIDNLRDVNVMLPGVLGSEIRLRTISVDPERNSPETLREFVNDHGLGHGGTRLTGKKEHVDGVLHTRTICPRSPTTRPARPECNARTGDWLERLTMRQPSMIARIIAVVGRERKVTGARLSDGNWSVYSDCTLNISSNFNA